MGLLSRSKKAPAPSSAAPPISGPLNNSLAPAQLNGKYSTSPAMGYNDYGAQDKYGRPEQNYGGALPSPPGSPIESHRGYSQQKPPVDSYRAQQQQQQAHSRAGNPNSNASYNTSSSSSRDYHSSSSRNDGSRHYSSDATTAYDDRPSTSSTAVSDRDVQGRMESLGLNGNQPYKEHRQRKSIDRTSCQSVEMSDGTVQQHQPSHHHQQQQQQHQQQQHYQNVPSAAPGARTNAGGATNSPSARPGIARPISSANSSGILSPTPSQASSIARKTSSRYNLADFTFIRTLGTGSFGRVHLVRSQHNSRSYAVKVLNKDKVVKMKQVEHTNSEREMLERVRHPFLVNLWGTFKDSKNLYMVMDFVAGGELFSLLRKSQRFPDPVAKFFAAEVALALDYLHSIDIIYRDLKPENILLGADGHVKITDFGFAKHVPDITWTLCGTPDYLAPEIVQSRGYNKSVDWYALGVLMFEMLAGYPPFFTEDANPMRLYEKIIAGKVRYPSYFDPQAKDLLKSLLTSDITKRFGNLANGSRDIFSHSWFQEVEWERLYRKEIPAPYTPKVDGDWDASNFDQYPEVDMSEYGSTGPDPHGQLFLSF
ncbi:cAMP-dependent protein kinase catalytic subunit [Pseudohyphozyma bogoriensis]|nr:cAMP-dependent protein kinase catalytic subunit [Pseudohyphozyma bogoriensis]